MLRKRRQVGVLRQGIHKPRWECIQVIWIKPQNVELRQENVSFTTKKNKIMPLLNKKQKNLPFSPLARPKSHMYVGQDLSNDKFVL